MNAVEVMTSESQERMLVIVQPDDLAEVLGLCERWEIDASVVGRVTDSRRFRVFDGAFDTNGEAEPLADVPVESLGDGPLYDRPRVRPTAQDAVQAADPASELAARFPPGADVSGELLALLATPTIADKSWVWRQYDHQLFLNTIAGPGADAAVLRVKGTDRALALTTDGKGRFCRLDPRTGGQLAVLEAARNIACVGARPVALVNCLNFGNPEHPEVMWQFTEVVDGMSDACTALSIPVVGGNVSFYNESLGHDIDPTPVVGVLGIVDELDDRPPPAALTGGTRIVVLGETAHELGGSEWAAVVHGLDGGMPPARRRRRRARRARARARARVRRPRRRRARLLGRRARSRAGRDGDRRRLRVRRVDRWRARVLLGIGVACRLRRGPSAGRRGALTRGYGRCSRLGRRRGTG